MICAPNQVRWLLLVSGILLSSSTFAEGTRQLGTGGASQLEGASGGGLVPWATIAGYAAREERGVTAYLTAVEVDDFSLLSGGVSAGLNNRVELSLSRQQLDISRLLPGRDLDLQVIGVKARLVGDLLYTRTPQISAGLQYKHNRSFEVASTVGALDDTGIDLYLSATKIWLASLAGYNALTNLTIRRTEANQLGLLGFGGDLGRHQLVVEASVAMFFSRQWLMGVEYRDKPNNLGFAREDRAWDVFVGYFPNRHWSLVMAYTDLGGIAGLSDQDGFYVSLEGSF